MKRDDQFEVQYLLSLMIFVLGLLTSRQLGGILNQWVGVLFLCLCMVHLTLITVSYSFEQITESTIHFMQEISRGSAWTLRLTTLGIIYILTHMIFNPIAEPISHQIGGQSTGFVQTVITFWMPVLPTLIISGGFLSRVIDPLRASRDISITVVPEQAKIYPQIEDSRPVLVEIENQSQREYEIDVEVELPDEVTAHLHNQSHTGKFERHITLEPESREPLQLKLEHNSRERRTEILRIAVEHKGGEQTCEVECFLR